MTETAITDAPAIDDEVVLVEVTDGVMVISINRPRARNAVTLQVSQAVAAALDELDERSDVTVGVLTGVGTSFCAGMDLKAYARGERPSIEGRGFGGLTERPPLKPLIAAVEGHALGGGFELALACDLVVASRGATFGLPEVRRGLVAAAGGLLRLPHRVPTSVAMHLVLTGGTLTAEEAHQWGLVNELTEDGESLRHARQLAARIAANGPLAVAASKQVIMQHEQWPVADRFRAQRELLDPVFRSADAQEGARAFTEKRTPQWKGC
ncbi:crotonase/enoyl-CoA hydratase family protein [Rhodococcus sp. IEGM 1381]|uniref:crotonase/enoyl-CoA hydratase family protein n=1 Tax=Rhodococcus sp. IEGM 1381 TaxID=3047085 RepID=UPI0024B76670|nr:crotonase/enoyl-CoA hydratase family protein [Rhodococcus sp. IEGM 1381]MDI9894442.1 crotonase/enoyl-CoA hydratase family protein [Rhodococcus sp. IEGM 1381]